MKPLGVLVPLVTPCTLRGEIDAAGLIAVTRHMLDAGCHALFVAGSTGRGPWFSRNARALICRTVAKTAGPQVPLFAGCMASGLPDMVDNARAMKDAGATVAVQTAPGYFAYSQREVEDVFLKFADASPLPVLVYDIPAFAGMKLDLAMVQRLARHGNVIGFKDSSSDRDRFQDLLSAFQDKPSFYLLQGKEHFLADSLLAGASGFVVSLLHVDPHLFVKLYGACRSGDQETSRHLQALITQIMKTLEGCFERRPETSTLFHFLNHVLYSRPICQNILLEHEGETPGWLKTAAEAAKNIR